jgi:hypothetical protein
MNLEIICLSHENCFDVSLKQFAFEILQLPKNYFENEWLVLLSTRMKLVQVHDKMTFYFYGFQSKSLE